MTLEKWLEGNCPLKGNPSEKDGHLPLYVVSGNNLEDRGSDDYDTDDSWLDNQRIDSVWLVNVLEDGTAITWSPFA